MFRCPNIDSMTPFTGDQAVLLQPCLPDQTSPGKYP
jgi:hypothetical protein